MLNKKYTTSIIGFNYISLLKGLKALRRGESVVIIDNRGGSFSNENYLNLSQLDLETLKVIFHSEQLGSLQNFEDFITNRNTLIYIDNIFIEFSDSPFANLKELARKFPTSFASLFHDEFSRFAPGEFDQDFRALLENLARTSVATISFKEFEDNFLKRSQKLLPLFQKFYDLVNTREKEVTELHYILQVMFQNSFSGSCSLLESSYLLISLLAGRFQLDEEKLLNSLLEKYKLGGGELKVTQVEDWGIKEGQLKYILLKSVDGLIEVDQSYYFGRLIAQNRLSLERKERTFLSLKLTCLIDHDFIDLFQDKRIVFLQSTKMGSDFPYWEFSINESGYLTASYAYADNLGTKASFYYQRALEDIYESVLKVFPGLSRAEWGARSSMEPGLDYWVEYQSTGTKASRTNRVSYTRSLIDSETGQKVRSLHYCGADRVSSFGLFGHLVDLFGNHPQN